MSAWKTEGIANLTGRRMVVTGANTGLGFASASTFARAGAEVVLAVRNADKGRAAAEKIRIDSPGASVRVGLLDLADLASVRKFGEAEAGRGPIDVLMNNAGVMLVPRREFTVDGFEMHMGVNHLGHVALTALLLPALVAAPAGRVVSLSSTAHRVAHRLDPGLNRTGQYAPMRAYGQSKLATLLFGLELDRRLRAAGSTVTSVIAHPGWSATELMARDDHPGLMTAFSRKATAIMGSSATEGARSQIAAAVDRSIPGGSFIGPALGLRGRPHRSSMNSAASDPISAAWLWDVSNELTGADFGLPAAR
ncbi:NADP-dependent 3-hydroxy acid dehydrogenase YdfG [Nakamurella panacisegetis]|uniref:NADP-dependent 3-hydroxy acid dehydrogenase YdfG n=1 Tax=Nakamurella panacisegetis TaxID=1090615 RepID=A0A1H0KBB5_9ACTN|nr:NADP-dependent 3-hydroxy acid dehydrogenase YdfG [Nakamurella panacisegetis]